MPPIPRRVPRALPTNAPRAHTRSYRDYLTFDEVRELTAPSADTVDLVREFVKRGGATRVELLPSGDALRVHMSASDASRLFRTPRGFHEFHHADTNQVRGGLALVARSPPCTVCA